MRLSRDVRLARIAVLVFYLLPVAGIFAQEEAAVETEGSVQVIDSTGCVDCHATSTSGADIADTLSHSTHSFLGCLDCHQDHGPQEYTSISDQGLMHPDPV